MVCSESNVTSCLAHVTKAKLSRVAKHSIFLRTATNRGVFREFYARFFMNGRFVSRSARVFSRYCTRGHAHNLLFESSALISQCLNSWRVTFRTHNTRTMYVARSILSSFLIIYTLGITLKQWAYTNSTARSSTIIVCN